MNSLEQRLTLVGSTQLGPFIDGALVPGSGSEVTSSRQSASTESLYSLAQRPTTSSGPMRQVRRRKLIVRQPQPLIALRCCTERLGCFVSTHTRSVS
jgi:hypothetical protein